MAVEIIYNTEARNKLKEGIDTLANAVKVTLGPKGRNVVIGKENTHITKDGVTVAKSISLKDPVLNTGVQFIKDVATKTGDEAGDGTTTATVLTQIMINEGIKNVTAGANPISLKKGIDKAVKVVIDFIKTHSEQINNDFNKIKQIATISANNDAVIGNLIADAMKKVTKDGVITVEEAKGTDTTVEVVEGIQFNQGYISPYFITNQEKMTCELENPYILYYDKTISAFKDIIPILEQIAQSGKPLLIIADNIESEALNVLVMNKMRGMLKVCAVKAPGIGDNKKNILEDMAIITDGILITEELGITLEQTTTQFFGQANRVNITKDSTTIINGKGKRKNIIERIIQLRNAINDPKIEENNKLQFRNRLAKIAGGVAVLYVGAASEVEMKEKKDRIDDALCATRAAVEEGIIVGGGTIFIRAQQALNSLIGANEDENTGINIVKRAIEEPLRQIAYNAGEEGVVIVQKVREGIDNFGWDAYNNKFVDLKEKGIIDPAKVTRVALENAASIAGMFLTTECVITDIIEEPKFCNYD